MTSAENKPDPTGPPTEVKADEISIEEIDRILQSDDPEFSKELGEIQSVGVESEVEIESAVELEDSIPSEEETSKTNVLLERFPWLEKISGPFKKSRSWAYTRWLKWRNQGMVLLRQAILVMRTWPGEFVRYSKSMWAALREKVRALVAIFKEMSLTQKLTWAGFITLSVVTIFSLWMNFRGVWLPNLYPPILTDLSTVADAKWEESPNQKRVALFKAFPQEAMQFLFPKLVVNLRRVNNYQNPMGAFEFFVELDSQDSALEVKAREHELHDRLQRALEGQSYNDLAGKLGKNRVKDLLRREINAVLTQGWVTEVYIKTMVLKP